MLLRWSLGMPDLARKIEQAVSNVIASGVRTIDIAERDVAAVSTAEFGDEVVRHVTERGAATRITSPAE